MQRSRPIMMDMASTLNCDSLSFFIVFIRAHVEDGEAIIKCVPSNVHNSWPLFCGVYQFLLFRMNPSSNKKFVRRVSLFEQRVVQKTHRESAFLTFRRATINFNLFNSRVGRRTGFSRC